MLSRTADLAHLFVYGTLRGGAGTEWSRFLAGASRFIGQGRIHGLLFHLDGYPGMTIATDEGAWVSGDVFLLNDPTSALSFLDTYEGCAPGDALPHEFERQVVTVLLDSGLAIEAWAYVYVLETRGRDSIPSGDYLLTSGSRAE